MEIDIGRAHKTMYKFNYGGIGLVIINLSTLSTLDGLVIPAGNSIASMLYNKSSLAVISDSSLSSCRNIKGNYSVIVFL